MKPCTLNQSTYAAESRSSAPEELKIAVTFPSAKGGVGPVKFGARLSRHSINSFVPDPLQMERAIFELQKLGFTVSNRGNLTVSVRGTRKLFEQIFATKLTAFKMDASQMASQPAVYAPAPGAPWQMNKILEDLIDDAYIQWPHIYMGAKKAPAKKTAKTKKKKSAAPMAGGLSPVPPQVGYYHLTAPMDLINLLNIRPIHQAGTTGRGVRVAMIDSGFAHSHPWFTSRNYRSTVVLAPGAANRATDHNGHGTGESANIFSVAPGVDFIGVKVDGATPQSQGASLHEGFLEALNHNPQVISVSLGFDLRNSSNFTRQLTDLPNSLTALEAEIQGAVSRGIVVVFSAGNGHYSFPGMMPEVISAGGVFVDQNGSMRASDYASAFRSSIYTQRIVPDFCGLVGLAPHADYISLPIPSGCEIDVDNSNHDGTTNADGWGVFSGTSAAAPQLAGICALLLEKNPGLTPSDIKSLLSRTARDVHSGRASPSSDENGVGLAAGPGHDSATGAGLVNAHAAWLQA